ncbi:MAG: 50S ribosomal protein L23 [Desulfovibrio sp.]|nr:50S ribosomal protein L23 [Desulfovibrio sp.]
MSFADALIKPLITEKTTMLNNEVRQVTFLVDPRVNQITIKEAVEKAFDVKVKKVNIVRRRPLNRKKHGKIIGQYSGWKKAYVMLEEGYKIEFFEGV